MTQKRKSAEFTALEESDRALNHIFCGTANSLSQLYGEALHQQKLLFQAGERRALEKLNEWILTKQQGGVTVTEADILAYLQNELDIGVEVPSLPIPEQQQHLNINASLPLSSPGPQMLEGKFLQATGPLVLPVAFNMDQPRNSASSNDAPSTPLKESIPFEVAGYSEMLAHCMQIEDQEV
ncbi:uncharacterized protein LOC122060497 isoform X1 [Macadamia integrifolia]|uniref:uncharacterized protein LOC122060497 isoform X1 n=1 Tax=Macadamia integrifolia TaxID=60698 RepID=UPI001C530139|nr:uncharacterized protein LOC122060497 isoform X1 [Macadamia integrifolia]XP_042479529.1 uncharacterized protein LOC122060497 isoform X1 [Macadamia integrifolia]XP_042479530.1 uncharacterized protein LOC122060497 isoform X1 [Macadamia integrifolia]XP_042479532.1 uncharacterized protein LOC122060497 isoform X1 [Macadamia integrifolia]XP_042479533.1 uncharacterized protein LOC122060497 isoform X1 [Macadamia integrifolia]